MRNLNLIQKTVLITILSVGFTSCSPKNRERSIHPNEKAPIAIQDSFQVEKTSTGTDSNSTSIPAVSVKINKTSLGKAFLFSSSIIDYYIAPRISHLKPKIVSFKKIGNKLAMFELDTMSVYDDIASDKLIQTFDINKETKSSIEINLNLGFSSIALKEDLGVAEMTSIPTREEAVISPTSSYLESAVFQNNELLIVQNSKVKSDYANINLYYVLSGMPTPIQTAEVNFKIQTRITPYKDNPNFHPKIVYASDLKNVGYFVTDKIKKNDGDIEHYANTWDIAESSGPITYVITKNTPEKYVEAIKEGILYWNRQLGRNVFKVETGGDPKEIGSYRRSIVHWAPWAKAGFAIASLQADPLTGELLTTNVYLTSAFPEGAKLGAIFEAKQRTSEAIANKEKLKNLRGVAPTGFDLNISCAMKMDQIIAGMASQIDILKSNPNFLERAQTDIVRFVTAHEVGHTIGLRHNFAGSLANEFSSWQQEDDAFTQYLADPNSEGGATSSSVMDYLDNKDILLGGSKIKTAELSYDHKAVDWGYKDGENLVGILTGTKDVLFCSDLEASSGAVMDCIPFDSGKDPVLNSIYNAGKTNKTLMSLIYEIILEMKFGASSGGSRLTFQDIFSNIISPEELSQQNASDFSSFQKAMTSNGRFLSLNRKFGGSAWGNNKAKYFSALTDKQSKEFEELGGIVGMIEKVVPTDTEHKVKKGWMVEQVQKIVSSPNFTSGKTLSGVDYTLNASDKEYIQSTLLDFANRYEEAYLGATLDVLAPAITTSESFNFSLFSMSSNTASGAAPYNYKLPVDSWANDLSGFVQNIVVTTENDQLILSEGTVQYTMPKPKHSLNTRLAAIKLLSEKLYGKTSLLKDLKTNLIKAEKERIGNALALIATAPQPIPSAVTVVAPVTNGTPVSTGLPIATTSTIGSSTPATSVAHTTTTPTLPSSADAFKKIKSLATPEIKAWALKELAVLKSLEDLDTAEAATTTPTSVSEIKKYIPDDYKE